MPGILDFLQGKNQSLQNIPRFSPQQIDFQNRALQTAQQDIGFDPIEARARAGFQRETVPLLSERFAKAGGIGSSGYQNALSSAGSELELGLAAQRAQHGLNLANIGLTPQYEQVLEQGQPMGFGQSLAAGLGESAPQLAELGFRGIKGLSSYFGNKTQPQSDNQASSTGSTIANIAGTGAGIAGAGSALANSGILGGLSGAGTAIGTGLAAAAPFALPIAGAAAVIALPFILSKLLED